MLKKIISTILILFLSLSFVCCDKEEEMTEEEKEAENSRAVEIIANFTPDSHAGIKFIDHELSVKGEYCYINGSIQNIDFDKIRSVKIVAKFLNGKGEVVDSASTTISTTLNTDEQKKFEIVYKGSKDDFAEYKLYAEDVE